MNSVFELEDKYLDVYATSTALTAPINAAGGEIQPTGGCTGCLSSPAVGDTASDREGRQIVAKSFTVDCVASYGPLAGKSTAQPYPIIYVALVRDKQTNLTTISSEDVFTNPSGVFYQAANPLRNYSWLERYDVLAHKTLSLTPASMTGSPTAVDVIVSGAYIHFKLSWRGLMPVSFTSGSTTANVSNVVDNSVHLIAFCSSTTLGVDLAYTSRMIFVG